MNKTKKLLFTLLSLVFVICMFTVTASAETYEYNKQKLEVQTEGDWQYVILTEAALGDDDREMGVKAGDAYTIKYTGTAASVNFPNKLGGANVSFVGYRTFKGNTAVQTVTVGTSVKYISSESFMDCSGLQQVLISQNVAGINNNAFKNCTALKSVTFHKDIKLKHINERAFENCKSLNKFKIPETVTTIGKYAFWNCDSMTEITIPDSVTSLGAGVFYHCDSLINVVIGNGVPSLDTDGEYNYHDNWGQSDYKCDGAFEGCISLQSVKIGSAVKTIGKDCFAGTALLNVDIPDNVEEIGIAAFKNCKMLKKAVIGSGTKIMGNSVFENCISLAEIKIGSGVATIGNDAFRNCDSLTTVKIPSNVTSLGYAAFYHCANLESVEIGNGVASLNTGGSNNYKDNWGVNDYSCEGTFEGCVKLKEIKLGNGIKSIGKDSFAGTALEKVYIPDNVLTIADGAFMNCQSLISIEIGNGVTSMGASIFENCDKLTSVKIGFGVISIGAHAFRDCDAIKFVNLPSNITSLGMCAFYHCNSLEKVIVGNGITSLNTGGTYNYKDNWGISDYACEGTFEGCINLTSVTLGSGLIHIGKDTFAGTQITSLTVPSKVSELADGAFAGAKNLKDIYFTGNWAAKAGGKLFDGLPADYKIHYIKNKIGYNELTYNKAEFVPITVSFDNNNDDVFAVTTDDQIMAPVGGYVIEPIIPAASGYRFVGWYKDSKCTSAWNFETDKVTKNTTLYAKWDDVNKVKPVRPEELTSDAVTGKTISLTWQAVDGATSYNVYVDGKKVNAKAITTSSYTVENLKADTTYEIEVTAVNSKGESPKSLILAKRTGELSAADMIPVAPTEVKSGKITETEIEITWKAVDGATSYNVYVDGKKVTKTAVAETKYTIASLKAGTTYVIEITAVNTVGESPKSKSISATTVAPKYNLGDVNNDGKITAADARFALRMSVKLEKPTEIQKLAADIDGNKNVTAADARIILRISVNLEKIDSYKK